MEPREFQNAVKGYEEEKREQYEFQRILATAMTQVHVKKRLRPEDLIKFPWEAQAAGGARLLSKEEAKEIKKRIRERLKK